MEIYQAPTLRLKVLNKRTHIMYIEMENVTPPKKKKLKKCIYGQGYSAVAMQTTV